jgi:tRNA A37 threonylcarbamoyladenosine dehydratase
MRLAAPPALLGLAAFAAGAAAGAAAVWAWGRARHDDDSAPSPPAAADARCGGADGDADGDAAAAAERSYVVEQLSRHAAFFGDAGEAAIERAAVVVVGVGGVGSHAAHMLARAGVARLRLVDFDNVSLSSLNRHASAARADVGTPKVAALARAIRGFMPRCAVEPVQRLFEGACAAELLLLGGGAQAPDFVLDCIDDVDTKAALLAFCAARGIRVISSLGAGGKADPTRLCVGDLMDVRRDPLAVSLRMQLRRVATAYGAHALRTALGGTSGGPACAAGAGAPAAGGDEDPAAASPTSSSSSSSPGSAASSPTAAGAAAGALMSGITCVYSSEAPRVKLLPLPDAPVAAAESGGAPGGGGGGGGGGAPPTRVCDALGALPGFRVRVLPVLGTMPAMFGQAMAAAVLCALAGRGHDDIAGDGGGGGGARRVEGIPPGTVAKMQRSYATWCDQRHKGAPLAALHAAYAAAADAQAAARGAPPLLLPLPLSTSPLALEEVEWVVNEAWRARSAVCRERLGTRCVALQLARWRPHAPSTPDNTVLLTDDEAGALCAATSAAVGGVLRAQAAAAAAAADGGGGVLHVDALTRALDAASDAAATALWGAPVVAAIASRLAWVRAQGW